jgi:Domain of unknown function (DUF4349)
MSAISSRAPWPRRILFAVGGFTVFFLFFALALRLTVNEMFRGIESSKVTGLAAWSSWDARSMWGSGRASVDFAAIAPPGESWIARNADLRTLSSSFDRSIVALHQIVSSHHGYLEDLRTESRSGRGRALAATLSVPAPEFDAAVSDLKTLGRTEAISEAGEDSAVKLASAERHLAATQTNLSRLQKLQRERKGELRDAVALEKDIAQANEAVAEAERQHEGLLSTVAQAHIRLTVIEDYRAPLEVNLNGAFLLLRNSLVEGASAIFSSASLVLSVLFEFGLPLLFWTAVFFYPGRTAWRRLHRSHAVISTAP